MKLGSLFSGSGGFELGGLISGITPVWASEIEPFPIRVTSKRFPNIKHLGDISKVKGDEIEPVDVITFGSPCQDLSVAGKRAGLKHESIGDEETTRSGLFMEAVRIIKEMRCKTDGKYPTFAVWENVPGAYSSNKGEDFRAVLEELCKIKEESVSIPKPAKWLYAGEILGDGYSIAWRTLDAQYWGVPQRRRRIYLVADFRGQRASKVLFEREGLRGNFKTCGEKGQGVTTDVEGSIGTADCERDCVIAIDQQGGKGRANYAENVMPTMCSDSHGTPHAVAYTLKIRSGVSVDCYGKAAGKGALIQNNLSGTLGTSQDQYLFQPVTLEPGIASREGGHIYENVCGTLRANAGDNQMAVAYGIENHPADSRVNIDDSGKCQTLTSRMGTGGGNVPMVMEEKSKIVNLNKGDVQSKAVLDPKGIAPALYSGECRGGGGECYVMATQQGFIDVETEVAVRKYEVDKDKLVSVLREHKGRRTNKEIAELLDKPLTLVEHWFRNDKSFAIPDPDVWFELKELLGITTTEFDQSITEFEFKGGNYDMRNRIYVGDTSPTLTCGCGNHLHLLSEEPVICLQGNGIDRADTAGCNGKGWKEDVSYTLNTIDRPAVAYPAQAYDKYIEDEVGTTLKASGGVYGGGSETLVAEVQLASGKEVAGCLMASGYEKLGAQEMFSGDYTVIENKEPQYIVRRLTPTECCRLQGFPDGWCSGLETPEPTEEDLIFWREVFETHRKIVTGASKPKSDKQIVKWLKDPHSDSAEYKLWGNGVALPNTAYVLQGIADELRGEGYV